MAGFEFEFEFEFEFAFVFAFSCFISIVDFELWLLLLVCADVRLVVVALCKASIIRRIREPNWPGHCCNTQQTACTSASTSVL